MASGREPGIKDVAVAAGVSVGTVSHVLNHPERVSEQMATRVWDAIDETGYVRNESARQLRSGSSRTIGLVVLDVTNPFFADVARGVERTATEHGSLVVVGDSGDDSAHERRHLEAMLEQRIQGLLVTPIGGAMPVLSRFAKLDIPVVLVDRVPDEVQLCSVAVDDVAGGRMATAHLLDMGRRRVSFIGGPPNLPQVRQRLSGAGEAYGAADLDPGTVESQHEATLTLATGAAAARTLIDEGRLGDALFAANDLMALGAMPVLQDHGIRVPDDVAVVGYDDISFASFTAVPLTTVRQPREALGRTAATMLFEELDDRDAHVHRTVVFDPELVVRASTLGPGQPAASGRVHVVAGPS